MSTGKVSQNDRDSTSDRLPLFDNSKAFLIFNVVLFHTFTFGYSTYYLTPGLNGYLTFNLLAVMPGFCFVAGALSKSNLTTKRGMAIVKLCVNFVILQLTYYVVYNTLFYIDYTVIHKDSNGAAGLFKLPILFLDPSVNDSSPGPYPSVYWFILCLIAWKIALPFVAKLKYPITCSLIIGMLVTFSDAGFNSQQVFAFFPFFVAGYFLHQDQKLLVPIISHKLTKIITASILLLCIIIGAVFPTFWYSTIYQVIVGAFDCLYGRPLLSTVVTQCTTWTNFGCRLLFYFLSLPACVGILSLMPTIPIWGVTLVGKMSFNVYIWHLDFLMVFLGLLPLFMNAVDPSDGGFVSYPYASDKMIYIAPIIALIITSILSVPLFVKYSCCCICANPPIDFLFHKMDDDGVDNKDVKVAKVEEEVPLRIEIPSGEVPQSVSMGGEGTLLIGGVSLEGTGADPVYRSLNAEEEPSVRIEVPLRDVPKSLCIVG